MLHNKTWKKTAAITLSAVLSLSLLSACGNKEDNDEAKNSGKDSGTEKIVAEYKGGEVTLSEFESFKGLNKLFDPNFAMYESIDPDFNKNLTNQLVAMEILSEQASDKDKEANAKKAKDSMDEMRKSYEDAKRDMKEDLKQVNITEDQLEDFMAMQENMLSSLRSKVKEADLQKSYDDKLTADKYAFTTASVRHILVGLKDQNDKEIRTLDQALVRANEVKDKLKAGGDFATLAKEYSDDPGSKDNGGLYADADVSGWVPEFKEAAATLPLNEISEPVKTSYGYHVMKVENRTEKAFADVKSSLESEAMQKSFSDFVEKDLPGLIIKLDVPKPEQPAAESGTDAGTGEATDPNAGTDAGTEGNANNEKADEPATENK